MLTWPSNGTSPVDTVDIYYVVTGAWTSTATGAGRLSVPRSDLAAASTGNKIVFAGGRCGSCYGVDDLYTARRNASGAGCTDVDIYDVAAAQWSSTATGAGSLSLARDSMAAAGAGSKIVFAGGCHPSPGFRQSFLICRLASISTRPSTSTTSSPPFGTRPRRAGRLRIGGGGKAAAAAGSKIIFAGGACVAWCAFLRLCTDRERSQTHGGDRCLRRHDGNVELDLSRSRKPQRRATEHGSCWSRHSSGGSRRLVRHSA